MKKIIKGCLLTFGAFSAVLIIGYFAIYFYSQLPNKIEFSATPIKKEKYLNSLSFENRDLPDFVINENESNILYQAYIMDEGLDMTAIYKVVIKLSRDIELNKSLPLISSDKELLSENISFNTIGDDGFKPQIKIPADKKTDSGRHLTIFSPQSEILMNLQNGSYSYSHNEIDQDGSVTDILIYDKESKLLYFERQRYHAFQ
jgi:hypothetical protein